jgi:hypothetical protein
VREKPVNLAGTKLIIKIAIYGPATATVMVDTPFGSEITRHRRVGVHKSVKMFHRT